MKVPKNRVLGPLTAVVKDLQRWNPELAHDSALALKRAKRMTTTRGFGLILLDLPKMGALIDKGLSSGRLDIKSIPPTLGFWPNIMFGQLFRKLFQKDGQVRPSEAIDPSAVFFARQVCYLYKKLRIDAKEGSTKDAVDQFFGIDKQLPVPTLCWDGPVETMAMTFNTYLCGGEDVIHLSDAFIGIGYNDQDLVENRASHQSIVAAVDRFQQVCDMVISKFPYLDPETLVPRHGPGAVADLKTGEDKYEFPFWSERLESFFPYADYGFHAVDVAPLSDSWPDSSYEPEAKLLAVPKTYKGPRLITSEPTAHQFLQQGVLRWIRKNLPGTLRLCVNFKRQDLSQERTLLASRSGEEATIDLSSASDRLSCWAVERVFRRNPSLLRALMSTRTIYVTDVTDEGDGRTASLRKFAGMGNAVTFPVQSIVYALACISAVLISEGWKCNSRNLRRAAKRVRVFGDDLIVPTSATLWVATILEFLELKINGEKSHISGHFRESCGMDAYMGHDVTPLYVASVVPPSKGVDLISWVAVSNNAHRKGLWETSSWMDKQVPKQTRRLLPVSSNEDSPCLALQTFSNTTLRGTKERYNKRLHRPEVFGLRPKVKVETTQARGLSKMLDYFLSTSGPLALKPLDYLKDPIRIYELAQSTRISLNPRWVPRR